MAFGEPGDEARNQVGYLIVRLRAEKLISQPEARDAIARIYPEFEFGQVPPASLDNLRAAFAAGAAISSISGEVRDIFHRAAVALGDKS